jgi:PAS domain S-box-containing protein
MASTRRRSLSHVGFARALIALWVTAVTILIVLNGPHYDFHELTLAILLILGCVLILGCSYLLTKKLKERDRAEELLRRSRERYSSLVENSLTGIFIGQDGVIRFSNAQFAETHGFAREEIVGQDVYGLAHPDDRAGLRLIGERLLSGELQDHTYELRCVTRDGRTIWVQRRSRLIEHEGRPAILVNEIDITAQREAAAAVREANEQVKRLLARFVRRQEQDRREIAIEIQEDFAQSLNAIKLRVESQFAQIQAQHGSAAVDSVEPIVADVQETVQAIRRLADKLYPMAVDTFGLVAALRWLFESHGHSHPDLSIRAHLDVEEELIPDDLKASAFRMIENVLSDVARCAPTGSLAVYLQGFGSKVMLALKADLPETCAFEETPTPDDLDIADFRTRIEAGGGQFSLSIRNSGMRIWSSWPLPPAQKQRKESTQQRSQAHEAGSRCN